MRSTEGIVMGFWRSLVLVVVVVVALIGFTGLALITSELSTGTTPSMVSMWRSELGILTSMIRREHGEIVVQSISRVSPPYPSLSSLGISQEVSDSRKCTGSEVARTIVKPSATNSNMSADMTITFHFEDRLHIPQSNPNHFIHDVWNGVMFLVANCVSFAGLPRRTVSIPHFRLIPAMRECRHTFHKADPSWQEQYLEEGVGTVVVRDRWLTPSESVMIQESCSAAHSFSPVLTYMTALLLAGPNGSIAEFESESRNPNRENPANTKNVQWLIRHEDRGVFRSHFNLKPNTAEGLKKAFAVFRSLTYHYMFESGHAIMQSEKTDASFALNFWERRESACRIVLYDRSQKVSHFRIWDDSREIRARLEKEFPKSRVVLLPAMPPRLADQVFLFSGLDVFITIHGGWEPNVMFLSPPLKDRIVFESPKECAKPTSDRWWMHRFRDVLGFELMEIPCRSGTSPNIHLLNDSLPLMIETIRNRGCE